jgi:hypothetical protein
MKTAADGGGSAKVKDHDRSSPRRQEILGVISQRWPATRRSSSSSFAAIRSAVSKPSVNRS